ncbi:MAG TPA: peptidylprolyl isomerase [Candidatus Tectomicrobia bacterium]|nr:peptidylprolyl isomerase [Candidatus Tectomicrobia bacterium]
MTRALRVAAAALVLGGCAVPAWVPWLGRKPEPPPLAASAAPAVEQPPRRLLPVDDEDVADRIIAVVNNDAITLAELQESMVAWRAENRQAAGTSEERVRQELLDRLIESRLQLQEAEREKITVDEAELEAELAERIKRFGVKNQEQFEEQLKRQGVTLEAVKRRLRDSMRVNKLVNRRVRLRVSVTDQEVTEYLDKNRAKLETGLSYHARHILVVPEDRESDAAWEAARIKAEMLRTELRQGADFAELARKHSQDPASARDGGDLGTLKRGELAEDVEAAILRLAPGEVSAPFRSQAGYHVFRLEGKETLEGEGLARIRQQIRDILLRQKFEERLDAWLKDIRQRAIIEVRM